MHITKEVLFATLNTGLFVHKTHTPYTIPCHSLWKQVEQYIKRILVEEDVKNPQERNEELFHASADAGNNFYEKGDFAASQLPSLETYLLKKVL